MGDPLSYQVNFRYGLRMELTQGILRGLGSIKEGSSAQLTCKLNPREYAQLPESAKLLSEVEFELEVQAFGEEYVLQIHEVRVLIQAPCSTCSHELRRELDTLPEHLAFEQDKVRSGEIDLREYLRDLFIALIPDCLPCGDNPCEWREDLDRLLAKNNRQKSEKSFHPFKELLSEKNRKSSQES